MTATVIHTRRPLHERIWRRLQAAWLRYEISSDEMWLAACVRDGIFEGEQIAYVELHLADKRVRLAVLEAS